MPLNLNLIDPAKYSFNSFLLLERFQIRLMLNAGGWLLDCPGDSERNITPNDELTRRGWEEIHYIGSFGKDVFLYRKQITK